LSVKAAAEFRPAGKASTETAAAEVAVMVMN
jgi:hypothetical protein